MRAAPRVALFATHPVQYQAPFYRELTRRGVELVVYYGLLPDAREQGIGFDRPFTWDVPLLDGYEWRLLEETHGRGRLGRFTGIRGSGIARALAEDRPDAVIITGWNSLYLVHATLASIALGIPRLLRAESNDLRPRAGWKRLGHRALFTLFDRFLAIGEANRRHYVSSGVPESHVFACRYAVDNAFFARAAEAARPCRDELRRRWGVPPESVCFLFAGKLEPKKRVLDLIAAIGRLAQQRVDVSALVVGAGPLESEARRRAEALPVRFTGFLNQTEICAAYVAADAIVLPSNEGETWGLVVNEAMACGLPAVVSDRVGCAADLVANGETGFTFPCGDVGALAHALVRTCDLRTRRSMGARARERVAAYSIPAAAQGTLDALDDLLEAS